MRLRNVITISEKNRLKYMKPPKETYIDNINQAQTRKMKNDVPSKIIIFVIIREEIEKKTSSFYNNLFITKKNITPGFAISQTCQNFNEILLSLQGHFL